MEHLPAELNDEADALSRLEAIPPREVPQICLMHARFAAPPSQTDDLWKARLVFTEG